MYARVGSTPTFGTRSRLVSRDFLLTFLRDWGILVLEATVTDRKAGKPTLMRYLLLVLVAVLVVYVGSGFVRQSQVRAQQQAELARIEKELLLAQQEAALLEKHLAFAQSPAAVEAWALENSWARPDEMPVIIIAPEGEPPAGTRVQDQTGAGLPAPQQAWWDFFFGDR